MQAATRYRAIAFLTGAGLLGVSSMPELEGLRIAATILLVGAAIYIGAAAGVSSDGAGWLARLKSLFPRTLACVVIAVLMTPVLIALTVSLANAVLGWADRESSATVTAFLVGMSLLAAVGGAAAAALAAVRGGKREARSENQQ